VFCLCFACVLFAFAFETELTCFAFVICKWLVFQTELKCFAFVVCNRLICGKFVWFA